MKKFQIAWTEQARTDLREIRKFIGRDAIDAEGRAKTVPFAETEPVSAEPAQESTPKPSRRRKPPRTLLDLDDEPDDDKSE